MLVKGIFTSRKKNNNKYPSSANKTTSMLKNVIRSCKTKFFGTKCVADTTDFRVKYDTPETKKENPMPDHTENDYTSAVLRLSEYLKIEDPMKQFYNFDFMCNSSVDGCKLYTCNSLAKPEDKYVMKITKLNEKSLVIDTENELKLMRACKHKNIAKVHSVIGHESCIWIAMDYCEHGSLYKFMEKNKSFDEHQIAYTCQQILSGIEYLHQQSIMHLDIKSDNILVDKDFNMIITDFGSSVQLENSQSTFDKFRGTPYWIAPEMIPKERCYNNKVDIWSFGILLWELMHGKPPRYDKDSLCELLLDIRYDPAPQLGKGHKWSSDLVDFLYKTLDKNPETRWSASQLLAHRFLKGCEGERNGNLFFSNI